MRAVQALSRLRAMIASDVRFPLERANGVQVVKTAAALARADVATTLVVRHSDPRPTPEILGLFGVAPEPNLAVVRLRVGHRRGRFALPRVAFLVRAALAARAALGTGAVLFTRDLQLADLLLGLGLGPVVYEAHAVEALMYSERAALYGTDETARARKAKRLAARERRVWQRAAGFVATTNGILDAFTVTHGPRPRSVVVPNGCDVTDPAEPPAAPEAVPRILYAGQLYPWKGVDVLVEAMAQVPAAQLVILGGLPGEADLERIRALVRRCGLEARTEMPGSVPQSRVARELARASVVAVPFLKTVMTERHTSPLKAFEAMAAGRPIVASDLPSSREFLRHEQNALLVAPGDPAALAAGLRRLLGDAALASRLARAAHAEAPLYSWDARARKLRALFETLATSAAAGA